MLWGSTRVRVRRAGLSLPRRGMELVNCDGGGSEEWAGPENRKGHRSMGLVGWQGSSTYLLGADPGLCRVGQHGSLGVELEGGWWIAPVLSSALTGYSCRVVGT